MYGCETWPPQSTCSLALMHLTRGQQDHENTVLAMSNAEAKGTTD